MKKFMKIKRSEKGFTLLEIIITIVVAAILGSFLITFMGTSITKSSEPVKQTRDLGTSIGSIETVSAAYALYLSGNRDQDKWDAFKGAWGCSGSLCTVPSGGIFSSKFETIRVLISTGDQKIVTYFMQ